MVSSKTGFTVCAAVSLCGWVAGGAASDYCDSIISDSILSRHEQVTWRPAPAPTDQPGHPGTAISLNPESGVWSIE